MKLSKSHFEQIIQLANESNMFINIHVLYETRQTSFPFFKRTDLVDVIVNVKIANQNCDVHTDSIKLYADEKSNEVDLHTLEIFIENLVQWIHAHKLNTWDNYTQEYKLL